MHLLWTSLLFLLAISFGVVQSAKRGGRIIGGTPARPHEFPFFVAIIHEDRHKKVPFKLICGGTIVSKNTVVTSESCLHNWEQNIGDSAEHRLNVAEFKIQAGAHKFSDVLKFPPSSNTVQSREVATIIPHNCFQHHIAHDISLVKTKTDFIFNEYVQPIQLPEYDTETPIEAEKLTMVGFGLTVEGNEYEEEEIHPEVLQKADVPVIDPDECKKVYNIIADMNEWHWWGRQILNKGSFCASDYAGDTHKGACKGDQGGGVYERKGDGGWIFRGIVSHFPHGYYYNLGEIYGGEHICNRRMKGGTVLAPDIHTRVSSYVCWIQDPIDWTGCKASHGGHNKEMTFGKNCKVTQPTTITTTTSKPTEVTTEAPPEPEVTDDKETVTAKANTLFSSSLFGISSFLVATFAPKIPINL